MARVTATGVEPESLSSYVARLRAAFRTALGADLDVSAESPQGQLISALALMFVQHDEALVAVSNGLSVERALGVQLDDLGSLLNIPRLQAASSMAVVTLTGAAGTTVPMGSRARTAAGDVFALVADVPIGAGGTSPGVMAAVEPGPVPAAAGALTMIVDLVAGWTAVTNAAAATLGRLTETDVAYRARYGRVLARNAQTSLDSILAAVLDVDGVTDAIIRENATAVDAIVQTVTISARSFLVIVSGGTDAAVGAAIAASKPAGVVTSGAVSVNVPHRSGAFTTVVAFSRVAPVPLTVTVDIDIGPGFPGDGIQQITQRVVDWAAGTWRSGAGDFDTSGLGIGEALDENRLRTPILSVPGHTLNSVQVRRKGGDTVVGDVALTEQLTIAAADVSVS